MQVMVPDMDAASLRSQLAALNSQIGPVLDLTLAEHLLDKAECARESVAALLLAKVQALLDQCESNTSRPVSHEPDDCALEQQPQRMRLAKLLDDLSAPYKQETDQATSPLDKKLREQNEKLMGLADPLASRASEAGAQAAQESDVLPPLRAAKHLRKTQSRHASQQKVRIALDNYPKDPGPLNPHMLAVQILKEVQACSPKYLENLLVFLDGLAALEQHKSAKSKKSAPATKGKT